MTGIEYRGLMSESPDRGRRALFDEYYQYVYTIVYGRIGGCASREDAEECVSDVFAEVFAMLDGSSRYSGDLRGVIATVAKRRAIDKYRAVTANKNHFVSVDDESIDNIAAAGDVARQTEQTELQRVILEQVEKLGEPDASIIIQKYYFNKNSREIARSLSMKTSAVRMRCSRALKKLRAALADLGIDE